MTATLKRALRQRLRQQAGSEAERNAQSAAICRHLVNSEWYRRAKLIGGYIALPREADVAPVLAQALKDGKQLVLPRTQAPPEMTLRLVEHLEALPVGRWGIPEPAETAPEVPPEAVDLLLVPLEGVDETGMRLGKGGGYYDALLSRTQAVTMGVALSWQWTESVPRQAWDKPLQAVCDAKGVRCFEGALQRKEQK